MRAAGSERSLSQSNHVPPNCPSNCKDRSVISKDVIFPKARTTTRDTIYFTFGLEIHGLLLTTDVAFYMLAFKSRRDIQDGTRNRVAMTGRGEKSST